MSPSNKKVTFAEQEIVFHTDAWREEDVDSIWYTRQELDGILQHCRLLFSGELKDEPMRGLELFIPEIRIKHQEIVSSVLKEQQNLKQEVGWVGVYPESLAQVAKSASAHRERMAQVRGMQDAEALKDDVWNTFKTASVSPERPYHADKRAARRSQRLVRIRQPNDGRAGGRASIS
jgi:hypothetical protein